MKEADNSRLKDKENDPLFHYGEPRPPWVDEDLYLLNKLIVDITPPLNIQMVPSPYGYMISGEKDQLDRLIDVVRRHSRKNIYFYLHRGRGGQRDLVVQFSDTTTLEIDYKDVKPIKSRKTGTIDLKTTASISIAQPEISEKPPKLADTLICLLLSKSDSMFFLGDTIEDYKCLRAERGILVANTWYWKQAVSASLPVIQNLTKKLVPWLARLRSAKRATVILGILEIVRRIFS